MANERDGSNGGTGVEPASEATMERMWSFLEDWQQKLTEAGAPMRVGEFFEAVDVLKVEVMASGG